MCGVRGARGAGTLCGLVVRAVVVPVVVAVARWPWCLPLVRARGSVCVSHTCCVVRVAGVMRLPAVRGPSCLRCACAACGPGGVVPWRLWRVVRGAGERYPREPFSRRARLVLLTAPIGVVAWWRPWRPPPSLHPVARRSFGHGQSWCARPSRGACGPVPVLLVARAFLGVACERAGRHVIVLAWSRLRRPFLAVSRDAC